MEGWLAGLPTLVQIVVMLHRLTLTHGPSIVQLERLAIHDLESLAERIVGINEYVVVGQYPREDGKTLESAVAGAATPDRGGIPSIGPVATFPENQCRHGAYESKHIWFG